MDSLPSGRTERFERWVTRSFPDPLAYETVWQAMRDWTAQRCTDTPDELWGLEHLPVYTLGQAGQRSHLHHTGTIPVVVTDRGGQVTYHGPGQAIVYCLVDLRRRALGIRALVHHLEEAVIALLESRQIPARRRAGAPGVYVGEAKVAALGLRVSQGRCYHGVALNVAMDLEPFAGIDPCGLKDTPVTQTRDLGVTETLPGLRAALMQKIRQQLDGEEGR
ncbi:lipoyl(octanoyl) transferase LipB [Ferrovum sp.]|uniref:lipoyl(octanoyl) transferase LipB n=1 Tax=Ferrovum sp. TaxID=2609467 RepID=UPI002634D9EB|nr:lipoyl(octanoyl) transferase LipB [Ferrovum sp.]